MTDRKDKQTAPKDVRPLTRSELESLKGGARPGPVQHEAHVPTPASPLVRTPRDGK
jgi:hypothetical protein